MNTPHGSGLSLSQFLLIFFGCILTVSACTVAYMMFSFQQSTQKKINDELTVHLQSATNSLNQIISNYAITGRFLSSDIGIMAKVNDPARDIDLNRIIISSKEYFEFEEAWLIGENNQVLYQSGKDASLLTDPKLKSIAADSLTRAVLRAQFADSPEYDSPILYLMIPVIGNDKSGLLVLGKVFSPRYLKTIFPQSDRGIFIFSENLDGDIVSANRDSSSFSRYFKSATNSIDLKSLPANDEARASVNTDGFTGEVLVKYNRYNTFVTGLVGYYLSTEEYIRVQRSFLYSTGVGLLASCLIILIGYLFTNRLIVHPIYRLRDSFQKVANGTFDINLKPKGLMEIQMINSSLNDTVKALNVNHEQLENMVKERTQQIQEKVKELENMNSVMVGRELRMAELKQEIQKLKDKPV